ncbi:MAG: hypothetical protein FWC71_03475 [Defluviitaleaceae bacterium]|nr:hypothetical protein [Defluviitaleaceae bacterium]
MMQQFPRTTVAGVSLPRMIIGTNQLLGWSHRTPSHDARIRNAFTKPEDFFPVIDAFVGYGIDAIMGVIGEMPNLTEAIRYYEDKTGKKLILIDTPWFDVADTAEARKQAEAVIKRSAAAGSTFCLPHHSSVEKLVDKGNEKIHRLSDYTTMVRDAGMIPGLSAHMPELIVYSDARGYDVETYIQIWNSMGYLMQVEVENIAAVIHNAKKPVMTIKSMAAGRLTPYVGLNFSWNTIRECDMVTVGANSAQEVHEDVEISFAALERRLPNLEKRASPVQNQAAFGNK